MARIMARALVVAAVILSGCSESGQAETTMSPPAASVTPSEAGAESAPDATVAVTPSASPEPSATAVGEAELAFDWAIPFTLTAPADWAEGEAGASTVLDIVDGTGLRTVLSVTQDARPPGGLGGALDDGRGPRRE